MNRAAAALAILLGICLVAYSGDAQVTVNLSPVPRMQFFDASGTPLAGGCIFTYAAGTSNPQATYVDSGGVIQNTNPIILDSGGFATIWLAQLAYKFVVFSTGGVNCASGTQQWTVDKIQNLSNLTIPNTWSAFQTFTGGVSITLPMTLVQNSFSNTLTAAVTAARNWSFPDGSGTVALLSLTQTFALAQTFNSGIITDTITGLNPATGISIQGLTSPSNVGENVSITAGAGATNFAGGATSISGGVGNGTGLGGAVSIQGGSGSGAGGSGAGGAVNLTGGTGGLTAGSGGGINIIGGAGTATGTNGGNIVLRPGAGVGAGLPGAIQLQTGPTATGTQAVLTGTGACATITTQTGGAWAGSAKCTGATAASTLTITFATTALNGWNCVVQDETTRANIFQQTSHATTSCTLTVTSVTQNDIFTFSAAGF